MTRDSLEGVALRMLSRRDASRQEVSKALRKALSKATVVPSEAQGWIKAILDSCEERGYLSDLRHAADQFAALRRRGSSRRKIEATLQKKGISGESITALVEEEAMGAEALAASRTVARRRLGLDPDKFQKELASLARAGFGYDDARRALEAAGKEEE